VNQVWVNKTWLILMLVLGFGSSVAGPDNSRSRIPSAKEVQELLPVICAGSRIKTENSTCSPCPQRVGGVFSDAMKLETVLYGHFLNARETDAIIDVSGCEPHANNYGGTVILRWKGLTRWEFVRYEPGARSNNCLKYAARGGRDLRVCRQHYSQMGFTIETFGLFDDALEPPQQTYSNRDLLTITSNSGQCGTPTLDEFQVLSVERRDLNRDDRLDLRLQISERHMKTPIAEDCNGNFEWGPITTSTLEFLFDGKTFNATPATKPILKYLDGFKA
jgi:hypothetical protein